LRSPTALGGGYLVDRELGRLVDHHVHVVLRHARERRELLQLFVGLEELVQDEIDVALVDLERRLCGHF